VSTAVAPKAREAPCHDATGEELAQLPLDETRQALPTSAQARLSQKGLEVLPDHLMQDGVLGLTADVSPRLAVGAPCVLTFVKTLCHRVHCRRVRAEGGTGHVAALVPAAVLLPSPLPPSDQLLRFLDSDSAWSYGSSRSVDRIRARRPHSGGRFGPRDCRA